MDALNNLPKNVVDFYNKTKERVAQVGSVVDESIVAWEITKSRFVQTPEGVWVARTSDFQDTTYYTFELQKAEEFISRTEDGEELHNYVLTDIYPDGKGTKPTESLLHKWAAWINESAPEVDTDHSLFDLAKKQFGGQIELVKRALSAKKGIAKAVKAFVENGKLVVSLLFDKRYSNKMNLIRGLSIEAAVKKGEDGVFEDGELFGFTFATNLDPVNPRAVRLA